jgi:hypothetical protein
MSTTIILADSIATPSISTNSLLTSNGIGQPGNILSRNGSTLSWADSSIIDTTNVNMNTKNITSNTITCTTLNTTTTNITNPTTFSNQINFTSPPISVSPTISSHLATKGYIDNNLTTKLYNLYLNTQPMNISGITGYKLSPVMPDIGSGMTGDIKTITQANTDVTVAKFISDEIGITEIPVSLWTLYIYGTCSSTLNNTRYKAKFELYRNSTTIFELGTSDNSSVQNTTNTLNPYAFRVNIKISTLRTTFPSDRIIITLNVNSDVASNQVITYFKPNFYSYAQLQVSNPITLPTTVWGTVNSDLNMDQYNIITSSISCPSKTLTVGNNSSEINIGTVTTATTLNISNTGGSIHVNSPLKPTYIESDNDPGIIVNGITTITTSTPTNHGYFVDINDRNLTTILSGNTNNDTNVITRNYIISKMGVYLIFFAGEFRTTAAASSNVSSCSVILKNFTTTTFICQQQYNMNFVSTSIASCKLNCGGIVVATQNNTQIDISAKLIFTGGTTQFVSGVQSYNINYVRIA